MPFKIKILSLGYLTDPLLLKKIKKFKSALFDIEIVEDIIELNVAHDIEDFSYSDSLLNTLVPNRGSENLVLAVTQVQLEDNYFIRILPDNRFCLTYYEMQDLLSQSDIPNENLLLRTLYVYFLVYKKNGNSLPQDCHDHKSFHLSTVGCIFDLLPEKGHITLSVNKPKICEQCKRRLSSIDNGGEFNFVRTVEKEISKIQISNYNQISNWIKRRPYWSLFISFIFAVILSLFSAWLYDQLKVINFESAVKEVTPKVPAETKSRTPKIPSRKQVLLEDTIKNGFKIESRDSLNNKKSGQK